MERIAYTDASFDEKTKRAGWSVVLIKGAKKEIINGYIPAPNINYAELWAVYMAAILLGGEKGGKIYTDSQTAIAYCNNRISDKPRTREQYINHMHNRVLAYKINRLNVTLIKTKAHQKQNKAEHLFNNIADLAARLGKRRE